MAKDIEKEIEEISEELEKSSGYEEMASDEDFERIISLVKEMGKENVLKSMENLTEEQKTLFTEIVEKAVDFDSENQGLPREHTQEQSEKLDIRRDHDKEDEKYVKPAAAAQKHQGGGQKVEGWEGQVIKSEEESDQDIQKGDDMDKYSDEMMEKMMQRAMQKGMSKYKMMSALEKKGYEMSKMEKMWSKCSKSMEDAKNDPKQEVKTQGEKEEYKKDMKKSEEVIEKSVEAEESLEKAKECKEVAEKEAKEEIEEHEEEMHKKKDDKKKEKMKKSLSWSYKPMDLLKSTARLGRNYHVSVNDEIEKQYGAQEEVKKSGGYLNENDEELKKSQVANSQYNVNDLIEKSLDQSECGFIDEAQQIEKSAFTVESFELEELCKSMNIDVEKAKEVLGDTLEKGYKTISRGEKQESPKKEAPKKQSRQGKDMSARATDAAVRSAKKQGIMKFQDLNDEIEAMHKAKRENGWEKE